MPMENLPRSRVQSRRSPRCPDPEQRFLDIIRANAWQLDTLFGLLLEATNVGAQRAGPRKQSVDLVALLDSLIVKIGALPTGHRVTVTRSYLPPLVEADAAQVEQAIRSLLGAVAHFSPPGSELDLSAEVRDDEVVLSVDNATGGIPGPVFNRLLHQRAQPEDSYAWLHTSLRLVRDLVKSQGGTLWGDAKPGGGVTISLSLQCPPA